MASSMAEVGKSDGGLEYLGFVRMIMISSVMCVLNLYEYAKQNSGSLKSAVGTVENAVTTVLGPVCNKYKGVLDDVLAFFDKKIGKALSKFDELAPPSAKLVVKVVQKGAEFSQEMVEEALVAGPRSAIVRFAILTKNFVVGHLPIVLYQVTRFPVVNSVSQKVIPPVTIWIKKYNNFVTKLAARGYHFFGYFPVVPIEDITNVFRKDDGISTPMSN